MEYCGHLGCTRSHIKALKFAKEQNFTNVLILEDDCMFDNDFEKVRYKLEWFLSKYGDSYDFCKLGQFFEYDFELVE